MNGIEMRMTWSSQDMDEMVHFVGDENERQRKKTAQH